MKTRHLPAFALLTLACCVLATACQESMSEAASEREQYEQYQEERYTNAEPYYPDTYHENRATEMAERNAEYEQEALDRAIDERVDERVCEITGACD